MTVVLIGIVTALGVAIGNQIETALIIGLVSGGVWIADRYRVGTANTENGQ
jgi:hypothetical protein